MSSPIPLPGTDPGVFARFISKVRFTDTCWEWTAARQPHNHYGVFRTNDGSNAMAHRFAWTLFNGPIPRGQLVLHTCDNPPCVRPCHLWLGTQANNMADMCIKGRHWNTQLTEDQVRWILSSNLPSRATAKALGMSKTQVLDIRRGSSWRHMSTARQASV